MALTIAAPFHRLAFTSSTVGNSISMPPAMHVRHRRCILGAAPDRPRRFLHRPEIDSRQHQHESLILAAHSNGSVILNRLLLSVLRDHGYSTRMKKHKHRKANCPPLAQNKQRHQTKRRSLLPNGKPSHCRSTAGPEYLSRNGQQPVLGAASSPKPEPISSGMSPQIHSRSGTCLIQPHWSFGQPISCPMPAFFSFSLHQSAAPSGRRGCGGHSISWPSHLINCMQQYVSWCARIHAVSYIRGSTKIKPCRASWVAFLR